MSKLALAFFVCFTLMLHANVNEQEVMNESMSFEEEVLIDDECDVLFDTCIIQCDELKDETTQCYLKCEEQYEQCLLKLQDEQ
jgi:hypothetical protein